MPVEDRRFPTTLTVVLILAVVFVLIVLLWHSVGCRGHDRTTPLRFECLRNTGLTCGKGLG